MSDYQIIRLPNGRELSFHKGIFSLEQYQELQNLEERIGFTRDGDKFTLFENAKDITHQERLQAFMGVLRQLVLEGETTCVFMSGAKNRMKRQFVEYSIYAYRYVYGIDLIIDTITVCNLTPDDELDMRALYHLAKYLKEKSGFLDTQGRISLPPISPVRQ